MTHSTTASAPEITAMPWAKARATAFEAGRSAQLRPVVRSITDCDGGTLAVDLSPLTDLPAFPTSSVDGFAVRGTAPWRLVGRVLAGELAGELHRDGTAMEIATGAMVPDGTEAILRVEDSTINDGLVNGVPKTEREWRLPGDEASRGDVLMASGTPVTPGIIGLAASCGHDTLKIFPRPKAIVLVFGDELLTSGPPGDGRIRDSLGPQVPAWLTRLGVDMIEPRVIGPIEDTLEAHVSAIREALAAGADMILTTGGTMHGPVDHLHPALERLDGRYVVNRVEVRPGFPMLLASVPRPAGGETLLAGLPGNPQSAVIALVSLVVPALAGMTGRPVPPLPVVELGAPVPGRGRFTHLALVRLDDAGRVHPLPHSASSMLRGLAQSIGFALIEPDSEGRAGDRVPLVPLPVFPGEHS